MPRAWAHVRHMYLSDGHVALVRLLLVLYHLHKPCGIRHGSTSGGSDGGMRTVFGGRILEPPKRPWSRLSAAWFGVPDMQSKSARQRCVTWNVMAKRHAIRRTKTTSFLTNAVLHPMRLQGHSSLHVLHLSLPATLYVVCYLDNTTLAFNVMRSQDKETIGWASK
jgi:hypothetical protein